MRAVTERTQSLDFESISRTLGFGIPPDEIERLSRVLSPLIAECRDILSDDLSLLEPIGTFHPEER